MAPTRCQRLRARQARIDAGARSGRRPRRRCSRLHVDEFDGREGCWADAAVPVTTAVIEKWKVLQRQRGDTAGISGAVRAEQSCANGARETQPRWYPTADNKVWSWRVL